MKGEGEKQVILGLYVDDMLIISANLKELQSVKENLSINFKMVDFGEVNKVLGIRVRRNLHKGYTFIDQEDYINEVLKRFNMGSPME